MMHILSCTLFSSRSLWACLLFFLFAGTLRATDIHIVPRPAQMTEGHGTYRLTAGTAICYQKGLAREAAYLRDVLRNSTGYALTLREGTAAKGAINLRLDAARVKEKEGYRLDVTPAGVNIIAQTGGGAFYAIQTLLQLLPPQIYSAQCQRNVTWTAPAVSIADAPVYSYRGMMLDVARYFFDKDFVEKYIDMMAMYKLNKLQLHLIDDSGWRLEIKKYPRLTEIGAWAGDDTHRLGGYYTQDDIREMVAYAALRHVEIIPEIEFPAHLMSAVAAYPWLCCRGAQVEVQTQHFISRDLLCVGRETSFQFLEDVFKEVVQLFPSKYINIGGDEAVYTEWEKCPYCQALKKKLGLEKTSDLQGYLTNRVIDMLKPYGKTVAGWNEIADRGKLNAPVVAVVWHGPQEAVKYIKEGHQVLLSPNNYAYFDFPERKTPGEVPAAAWSAPVPIEKTYSLHPERYGKPDQLLGVQACLWSDLFIHGTQLQEMDALNENRSEHYAEYLTFPRLLALSEIDWTQPQLCDFADFRERLKYQFARLDAKDCHYRVPEPTIVSQVKTDAGTTFTLASPVEGATVRYRTDGHYPNVHSPIYTSPVTVDSITKLRAITVVNNRHFSLPIYFEEKYANFKKYGTLLGEWKPAVLKDTTFIAWRLDATGKVTDNGKYEVTFLYTGDQNKLQIRSVKLFKRDELVAEDTHRGETGVSNVRNVYTLDVKDFEAGTPFTIEAEVRGDVGPESQGAVFIRH